MDTRLAKSDNSLSSSGIMRTPRSVEIEITSRCNLNCTYCYFFDNPEGGYGELATKEWLNFFDQLGNAAVMDVCLAGGEPFLRDDLPLLIDGIVLNRMRFSILSNGTCIDPAIANHIRSTNRCDYVQVSIDGSCASVHDTCRGSGSFDLAVRGIRALQNAEIPIQVRVTLHKYNIDDLEQTARFLLDELHLGSFTTNAAGYLGTCRQHEGQLLSIADREKAMHTLTRLARKYPGRISAQAGPHAEARIWSVMERQRCSRVQSTNGGRLTGCGCPWTSLAVRSDGTFIPCPMLPHMKLGQINQDRLETVWHTSKGLELLRKRKDIPLSSFDSCRDCAYIHSCTGNCPGLSYSRTGTVNQPSPDGCLQRFLEGGGALPLQEQVE